MNLVPVAYKSIRLTIVIFSSNNCQTKKRQLSDDYFYAKLKLRFSIRGLKC